VAEENVRELDSQVVELDAMVKTATGRGMDENSNAPRRRSGSSPRRPGGAAKLFGSDDMEAVVRLITACWYWCSIRWRCC